MVNNNWITIAFCLSILFLGANVTFSQDIDENIVSKDSIEKDTSEAGFAPYTMSKSPMGAIFRSLAVPGWGQIYVENYWKAPLFFGGSASLVYMILWNNNKFLDAQKDIDKWSEGMQLSKEYLKRRREFYRDQRDMSAFYLLGVYVLAAVDAYVNAHLYDFNVDDLTLSFSVSPYAWNGLQLNIALLFNNAKKNKH